MDTLPTSARCVATTLSDLTITVFRAIHLLAGWRGGAVFVDGKMAALSMDRCDRYLAKKITLGNRRAAPHGALTSVERSRSVSAVISRVDL